MYLEEWGISIDDLFIRNMGNGKNTYFWKDKWNGELPLNDLLPDLYKIELNKNYKFSDHIEGMETFVFNWRWSRQPRRGCE